MKIHDIKEIIKIVHYKEVKNLLDSIIGLEKVEIEIACNICGTKITAKNFKALTRKSGKILFCCDSFKWGQLGFKLQMQHLTLV
jgi:hypothetical protein